MGLEEQKLDSMPRGILCQRLRQIAKNIKDYLFFKVETDV